MTLSTLDFVIIGAYVVFALVVGSLFFKKANEGASGFFVGDRKLPWWIAGTSIVATTFAADTPLAVAGIVGTSGIAGNWIWWCWAIAHLVATFFFARLWRRSGVITDAEITELRYSGSMAAKLRAFKAIYYGLFINCLTMAWVILAMVKISAAFFPDVHFGYVITACVVTSVIYTSLGGFRGVVVTDMVQFSLGMIGAIALAYFAVSSFNGIGNLEEIKQAQVQGQAENQVAQHAKKAPATSTTTSTSLLQRLADTAVQNGKELAHSTDFIPDDDNPMIPTTFFLVLLIAGWWRNAEGNGYLVQRLAATKDEGHAQAASLWFSIAHNALRPWPWLLVGLTALVFYPNLSQRPSREVQGKLYLEDETLNLKAWPAVFEKNDEPVTIFFTGLSGYNCSAEFGGQFVKLVAGPEKSGVSVDKATFKIFNRDVFDPLRVDCQVGTGFFPGILVGKMPKSLTKISKNKHGDEVNITVSPAVLDVLQGGTLSFSADGTELSEDCEVVVGNKKKKLEKSDDIFSAHFKGDDDVIQNTRFEPLILTCGNQFFSMGKIRIELKDREMGYPLMMKRSLPAGWLGLVIASLLAAFMSTIDTHTNWGASYMVQDLYRRFFKKDGSEAHYVMASRISIFGMAVLAGIAATFISSIAAVWGFLITLGAGLGSVSAARWYWHRVTPHAEFAAMGVTTLLALGLEVFDTGIEAWQKIILVAVVSLLTWIPVALYGPQNDEEVLKKFAEKVRPAGPGWKNYVQGEKDSLQGAFARLLLGCVSVFAALFGIGKLLFGDVAIGALFCIAAAGSLALILVLSKSKDDGSTDR